MTCVSSMAYHTTSLETSLCIRVRTKNVSSLEVIRTKAGSKSVTSQVEEKLSIMVWQRLLLSRVIPYVIQKSQSILKMHPCWKFKMMKLCLMLCSLSWQSQMIKMLMKRVNLSYFKKNVNVFSITKLRNLVVVHIDSISELTI